MNFFVQAFSSKHPEGKHNFFIYLVSKLLEKSSSICNCSRNKPIMDIFLRTFRRQMQLISFVLFKINGEILKFASSNVCFSEMKSTMDIFLRTFRRQKQLFYFVSKLGKITCHICVALKRTRFFWQCVIFLISEW